MSDVRLVACCACGAVFLLSYLVHEGQSAVVLGQESMYPGEECPVCRRCRSWKLLDRLNLREIVTG